MPASTRDGGAASAVTVTVERYSWTTPGADPDFRTRSSYAAGQSDFFRSSRGSSPSGAGERSRWRVAGEIAVAALQIAAGVAGLLGALIGSGLW